MITITGSPKEIAALVDELQERRKERVSKEQAWDLLRKYQHIKDRQKPLPWEKPDLTIASTTTDRIAACGPTTDKLGDPAASGNKIEQYLRSKDPTSEDQDSDSAERQEP